MLEQAGLVTTEKVGGYGPAGWSARLEEEAAWIERYRQLWSARFEELDNIVEELKRREKTDGRKKGKVIRPLYEPHDGGAKVRARSRRHANVQRPSAHRVRGVDQCRLVQALVAAEIDGNDASILRNGCSSRRQVPPRVRAQWHGDFSARTTKSFRTRA